MRLQATNAKASAGLNALLLIILTGTIAAAQDLPVHETDLAAFFQEVDTTYPFFDLKGNREEWEQTKQRLATEVKQCASDTAFLGLVVEAIRTLHDSHMWIRDAKAEIPPLPKKYCPGVSFLPATKGRVVVMYAPEKHASELKTGTIISRIDGIHARRFLEERARNAWASSFSSSHQRTRLYEFRVPLKGEQGDTHTLTYLADREEQELTVTCDVEARGWPHTYNLPADMTRVGRSFFHTPLPSGAVYFAYCYLRRVDGSAVPGFQQAREAYPDAKGWIIDLRGNGGGGYDNALIDKFKALPRPVAVLIDAGCMSAGETVARDLRRYAEARLFGSRTAGASSSKRTWTFPSGIASVTFSTRSRWRGDGQPIEFNGIEPDIEVEADPEETAQGLNSAILRAEAYLEEVLSSPAAP
jgi:Peptidase family S41